MNRRFNTLTVVVLLGVVLLPFQGHSATLSYQYDKLNRLTEVLYEGGTVISYSYDPAGNRLSRSIIINSTLMSMVGDINDDGFINLADAILVLQVVANMKPVGIRSDYAVSGADAGGSSKIGLEEVIYILQKSAMLR